jgi:hypothetical protein
MTALASRSRSRSVLDAMRGADVEALRIPRAVIDVLEPVGFLRQGRDRLAVPEH